VRTTRPRAAQDDLHVPAHDFDAILRAAIPAESLREFEPAASAGEALI
jgi:hypothetical protein